MNKLTQRFDALLLEVDNILENVHGQHDPISGHVEVHVDAIDLLAWQVKAANAIEKAAGPGSPQAASFKAAGNVNFVTNKTHAERQRAVVAAVRDDYDGGFLLPARSLARAEVFDTELELAKELLQQGYDLPAAIVARTVLETALRGLCDQFGISHGKLDTMNSALAKAQAYSVLVQKKVTAMSDVGNSAAHGKRDKFNAADVEELISGVERFLLDFPSS